MGSDTGREVMMSRIVTIFRDVFDDDSLAVTEATTIADVEDWDSLMHITLCMTLEREFNVRLDPAALANIGNVGEMADMVLKAIA